jgi:hypothetical protein
MTDQERQAAPAAEDFTELSLALAASHGWEDGDWDAPSMFVVLRRGVEGCSEVGGHEMGVVPTTVAMLDPRMHSEDYPLAMEEMARQDLIHNASSDTTHAHGAPVGYALVYEAWAAELPADASTAQKRGLIEAGREHRIHERADREEMLTVMVASISGDVWMYARERRSGSVHTVHIAPGEQMPTHDRFAYVLRALAQKVGMSHHGLWPQGPMNN